jgi:UDP-N-acetylglucosamine 4-epimerase
MNSAWQELQHQLLAAPKRWTVTGVAGFIGSNILETLLKLNQIVVGGDNFATGHRSNLEEVQRAVSPEQWQRFSFIEGDITSAEFCAQVCTGSSYVLHQAALGSVPRSISDPMTSHLANVDGFLQMLIAARDANIKRLVYASSSSVYGDHPGLPKVEAEIGEQVSPYAVTKYVNELYASVFAKRYQLHSIGLRYFNVFGPRQDPSGPYAAVIPCFTAALFSGEPAVIYGDGETSRDFCFVDNVVQVNILSACSDNAQALDQVYNVAVGERLSLTELHSYLANAYQAHKGVTVPAPEYRPFREGDVRHSLADISKAEQLLGYQPTHRAAEALSLYIEWFLRERASVSKPSH